MLSILSGVVRNPCRKLSKCKWHIWEIVQDSSGPSTMNCQEGSSQWNTLTRQSCQYSNPTYIQPPQRSHRLPVGLDDFEWLQHSIHAREDAQMLLCKGQILFLKVTCFKALVGSAIVAENALLLWLMAPFLEPVIVFPAIFKKFTFHTLSWLGNVFRPYLLSLPTRIIFQMQSVETRITQNIRQGPRSMNDPTPYDEVQWRM